MIYHLILVTNAVSGDDYGHDCKRFEKFLNDLLRVPQFRDEENIVKFLTEEEVCNNFLSLNFHVICSRLRADVFKVKANLDSLLLGI